MRKQENRTKKFTNLFLITKAPNFNNIGVNNVYTVFKDLVGEDLMRPEATPISCVVWFVLELT